MRMEPEVEVCSDQLVMPVLEGISNICLICVSSVASILPLKRSVFQLRDLN